MQQGQCPKCGFINPVSNKFCGRCATQLIQPLAPPANTPTKGWNALSSMQRLGIIVGGILLLGLIANLVDPNRNAKKDSDKPPSSASQPATTPPAGASSQPSALAQPAPSISAAEHLAEAKRALADGYNPKTKAWGRVTDARTHLQAITSSDKEFAEADKLWLEVRRREAEIEKWSKVAAREFFASNAETNYLKQNMDVDLTLSGPDKTTIKFKYVLMSRPMVYQLTNDSGFMGTLREYGFKKIIFTDGYFHTWTYDVD